MKTTFEASDIKPGLRVSHPTSGDAMLVHDIPNDKYALLYMNNGNYNVSPFYTAAWWLTYLNGPNDGWEATTVNGIPVIMLAC